MCQRQCLSECLSVVSISWTDWENIAMYLLFGFPSSIMEMHPPLWTHASFRGAGASDEATSPSYTMRAVRSSVCVPNPAQDLSVTRFVRGEITKQTSNQR